MNYYSTNDKTVKVGLLESVMKGVPDDGGLYMPERVPYIPKAFFKHVGEMSVHEISFVVASTLFGEDIESEALKTIVTDTFNFEIPLIEIEPGIFAVELFHGPTLSFKDIGARFMARMLEYFCSGKSNDSPLINVLVATSGDTGCAVANGFLNIPGVRVFVLYPSGKVGKIQEAQFSTLGANITAIEVDGTYHDCQVMVMEALKDRVLNEAMILTSANSINVARFLSQMFYYYYIYARLNAMGVQTERLTIAVPSGNFGNLSAALYAKRMGLHINKCVTASYKKDIFDDYLKHISYSTENSAVDIGQISNFARILDLYNNDKEAILGDVVSRSYDETAILQTIADVYKNTGYILDPHGAATYNALKDAISANETGVFLAAAHPAKFQAVVEKAIGSEIEMPEKLAVFLNREKQSVKMSPQYPALRKYLLNVKDILVDK